MRRPATFEYDTFIALTGFDLCRYMDALLADPNTKVSKEALQRIVSDLPTYDEYHLVYALEFATKHCPDIFAPHLPQYLAHQQGSVVCAAYNALDRLPDENVTPELIRSARRALASVHPKRRFFGDIIHRLQNRLHRR